jgi:hypothetical protein
MKIDSEQLLSTVNKFKNELKRTKPLRLPEKSGPAGGPTG